MILLHECEQGESTAHSSSSKKKKKKIILITFCNKFCINIGERMWTFIASMQQHMIFWEHTSTVRCRVQDKTFWTCLSIALYTEMKH